MQFHCKLFSMIYNKFFSHWFVNTWNDCNFLKIILNFIIFPSFAIAEIFRFLHTKEIVFKSLCEYEHKFIQKSRKTSKTKFSSRSKIKLNETFILSILTGVFYTLWTTSHILYWIFIQFMKLLIKIVEIICFINNGKILKCIGCDFNWIFWFVVHISFKNNLPVYKALVKHFTSIAIKSNG